MMENSARELAASLVRMRKECETELARLSDWWIAHLPHPGGGYHGAVGCSGTPVRDTPVSVILMTRLLWFFSAAADFSAREDLRREADRAANWLHTKFLDPAYGGVVWSITPDGAIVDGRKHGYAQGFAIYALARHFRTTGDTRSLQTAEAVFRDTERHFRDARLGGYREAFRQDWGPLDDFRLSEKEGFAPKTMNTHLHIMEAYAELARSVRTEAVLSALRHCIEVLLERILDSDGSRLRLFMTDDWQDRSEAVSFGHDIEASWLLPEAAEILGDAALLQKVRVVSVALAKAVWETGTGPHGEVFNERRIAEGDLDMSRIWWVQAEALIGFLNAHALSGRADFARAALRVWRFTKAHIIDPAGEWRWYSDIDGMPLTHWAGPWKACYHNGRAMMEAIRRIDDLVEA